MYPLALDQIKRGEKIATDYEISPLYLQLLEWKRKILIATTHTFNNRDELNTISELIDETNNTILNNNSYWKSTINLVEFFGDFEKAEELLKSDILVDENNAKSINSKVLFYHIHYSLSLVKNDFETAEEFINKLILLLENHKHRIEDNPKSYITALNNMIRLLLNKNDYERIPAIIKKVRAVPENFKIANKNKISFQLWIRTFNVELEMYRDLKDYSKGVDLINRINEFIGNNKLPVTKDYQALFYYQFAYIFFMNGDFNNSLHYTNELLRNEFKEIRSDLNVYIRFLNLMLHYEFNNVIVLKYSIDSVRRYLKKVKDLHGYEKELLKLFSKLSVSLPEKHLSLFIKTKQTLFENINDQQKKNILDYLDFENWIENKIIHLRKE